LCKVVLESSLQVIRSTIKARDRAHELDSFYTYKHALPRAQKTTKRLEEETPAQGYHVKSTDPFPIQVAVDSSRSDGQSAFVAAFALVGFATYSCSAVAVVVVAAAGPPRSSCLVAVPSEGFAASLLSVLADYASFAYTAPCCLCHQEPVVAFALWPLPFVPGSRQPFAAAADISVAGPSGWADLETAYVQSLASYA